MAPPRANLRFLDKLSVQLPSFCGGVLVPGGSAPPRPYLRPPTPRAAAAAPAPPPTALIPPRRAPPVPPLEMLRLLLFLKLPEPTLPPRFPPLALAPPPLALALLALLALALALRRL